MTLPKKRSRKIIVDNQSYRYLIVSRGENLSLTIEADNIKGQLMCFQVPYVDPWLKFGVERVSDEKLADNEIEKITPSFVRKVILFAIEKGWQPLVKNKPMQITLETGELKLLNS